MRLLAQEPVEDLLHDPQVQMLADYLNSVRGLIPASFQILKVLSTGVLVKLSLPINGNPIRFSRSFSPSSIVILATDISSPKLLSRYWRVVMMTDP